MDFEKREPVWKEEQEKRERLLNARRADWRVGSVVYQVIVDRFAPPEKVEEKKEHYAHPRTLRPWDEVPKKGHFDSTERVMQGEMEFWGGDLKSLAGRLDHLHDLGIQTLYLNPIFDAFTNHKYDANDYFKVDPQYGENEDLRALADALHERGMYLMLDGVFNHVGRRSPLFQRAEADPHAPERDWFIFDKRIKQGYRGWRRGANLPELNLENAEVRRMLWDSSDSVVRRYIREENIDGWRLDVAPDIGPAFLEEITRAAHAEKPGSWVIGECWNYPIEWLMCLDGIMNMHVRRLLLGLAHGQVSPRMFNRALEHQITECDYEGLLRSHLILENHDTRRIATDVPDDDMRLLLRALQFTLPGSPVVYYGSEAGMKGGDDPGSRAPMRWDLLEKDNVDYESTLKWTKLRRENPALTVGDCRVLDTDKLVSFVRFTDKATQTLIVAANRGMETVTELVPVRYSLLMDAAPIECLLSGERLVMGAGTAEITVPPKSMRLFRTADRNEGPNYSMYKRVP